MLNIHDGGAVSVSEGLIEWLREYLFFLSLFIYFLCGFQRNEVTSYSVVFIVGEFIWSERYRLLYKCLSYLVLNILSVQKYHGLVFKRSLRRSLLLKLRHLEIE